jgi:hypothetical protein
MWSPAALRMMDRWLGGAVCSIALLTAFAFTLPAGAQVPCGPAGVAATLDPQLALPGEPIQVTLTNNSSGSIYLPSHCVYTGVDRGNRRQGENNGRGTSG